MGHIRLGILSQSKKWRDVIGLLDSDASLEDLAEAAARASELDLGRASGDPAFQFVSSLLVQLPLLARAPGFDDALSNLGLDAGSLGSVSALLAGLSCARRGICARCRACARLAPKVAGTLPMERSH